MSGKQNGHKRKNTNNKYKTKNKNVCYSKHINSSSKT